MSQSDEDLRLFASSNHIVSFNEISNDLQEDVLENPSQILCQPPKQNSDIESDIEIDFKSMQKNGSVKKFEEVGHNEKDLKGLYKTFVGKKRFIYNKFKTEEHDDGSSTDDERSSSDDDTETDGDFVVRQGKFVLEFSHTAAGELSRLIHIASRYTTSFQRLEDIYTTSATSYKGVIGVETTSCAYWVSDK